MAHGWWPEVLLTGNSPWCFSTHSHDAEDVGDELGQDWAVRSPCHSSGGLEEQSWKSHGYHGYLVTQLRAGLLSPEDGGSDLILDTTVPGCIPVFVGMPTVLHLLSQLPACCFLRAALQAWSNLQSLFQRLG